MPTVAEQIKNLPRHEHLDDLRGISEDPHPRKTRRVRWIGQYNPMADPIVQDRMIRSTGKADNDPTRKYSRVIEAAVRLAAAKAVTPTARRRILEHNHRYSQNPDSHLTRTYIFEQENGFTCDMDLSDADVLFSSEVAKEFVDLDDRDGKPAWSYTPVRETIISVEEVRRDDPTLRKGQIVAITQNAGYDRKAADAATNDPNGRLAPFQR
jgi:hypothetical protein